MNLQVGIAKKEMPLFFKNVGMLGYGQTHNVVDEVATPLYARTIICKDEFNQYFIFINLEIAFVTIALKEEVTRLLIQKYPELNLTHASILITAQHTHSAPGGYSHYPFYNFTTPNFRPLILKTIVDSVIESVTEAMQNFFKAHLKIGYHKIPDNQEVAFNRSMSAYLNNSDVNKILTQDSHLAIDRKMQVLEIYDDSHNLKAHINWFGVHATSISSYNTKIHHDNKGVAAAKYEKDKNCLAIFAQAAAGDVSPNFIWDKKINRMRGKFEDQYDSAAYNGELQASEAQKITTLLNFTGKIKTLHTYINMELLAAAPAHGVAFFKGTLEGPGLPHFVCNSLKLISRLVKNYHLLFHYSKNKSFYEEQGNKDILLDHRTGLMFGIPLAIWKKLPIISDPMVKNFCEVAQRNSINTLPWVPSIIPIQIVQIGLLAIIAVPGEITTIAAERLKKALAPYLNGSELVISSYANAYMGYITTPEEYDMQCYEGGHNVYGRNTLSALIESYLTLLNSSQLNLQNKVSCFKFQPEELALRTSN